MEGLEELEIMIKYPPHGKIEEVKMLKPLGDVKVKKGKEGFVVQLRYEDGEVVRGMTSLTPCQSEEDGTTAPFRLERVWSSTKANVELDRAVMFGHPRRRPFWKTLLCFPCICIVNIWGRR